VDRILVDANLMLMLLVGAIDPASLGHFNRLRTYTPAHFNGLAQYVAQFARRITTPHILAEVSNLLEMSRQDWLHLYAGFILKQWQPLQESHTTARVLASTPYFAQLGLTDAAIIKLARPRTVIVTADRQLWHALQSYRVNAFHFSDIARALGI
jgi:hypothetical protein